MTKLTILDIAARAGVSKSTVSLVLRGSAQVRPETKEKVLQVIQESGYVYNRHAASMRAKKSKAIGYIVSDINSLYCAELLRGVEQVLDSAGYSILIASASDSILTIFPSRARTVTGTNTFSSPCIRYTP